MPDPFPVERLDTAKCKHCDQTIRTHCTEHEGAFFFMPCVAHLLAEADETSPTWRTQVTEAGLCLFCAQGIEQHFQFETPQALFQMRPGAVAKVAFAPGTVVFKFPYFLDCRPAQLRK